MVSAHIKLKVLEDSLRSARNLDECWRAVETGARLLGYSHITAMLAGRQFSTAPDRTRESTFWQMRLNLPGRDYLNLTHNEHAAEQPVLLIPFVEVVRRVLPEKMAELAGALAPTFAETESLHPSFRSSSTRTVMSSDCAVPSVNPATAS